MHKPSSRPWYVLPHTCILVYCLHTYTAAFRLLARCSARYTLSFGLANSKEILTRSIFGASLSGSADVVIGLCKLFFPMITSAPPVCETPPGKYRSLQSALQSVTFDSQVVKLENSIQVLHLEKKNRKYYSSSTAQCTSWLGDWSWSQYWKLKHTGKALLQAFY